MTRGSHDSTESWERLLALLAPVHDRARITARRLARSSAEGDDLFQEALLRAHDRLPSLRDPERFGAWFYAVLISVHRNRCRRSFWKRFARLDGLAESDGPEPSVEPDPGGEREAASRMARALAVLPAAQREAIVLHVIDGFTMEEVADIQKVTVSAVKSRVSRGREALRRHYGRRGIRSDATRRVERKEEPGNG